jgi:hypothetical protein
MITLSLHFQYKFLITFSHFLLFVCIFDIIIIHLLWLYLLYNIAILLPWQNICIVQPNIIKISIGFLPKMTNRSLIIGKLPLTIQCMIENALLHSILDIILDQKPTSAQHNSHPTVQDWRCNVSPPWLSVPERQMLGNLRYTHSCPSSDGPELNVHLHPWKPSRSSVWDRWMDKILIPVKDSKPRVYHWWP